VYFSVGSLTEIGISDNLQARGRTDGVHTRRGTNDGHRRVVINPFQDIAQHEAYDIHIGTGDAEGREASFGLG
jgi:hypothetical protein